MCPPPQLPNLDPFWDVVPKVQPTGIEMASHRLARNASLVGVALAVSLTGLAAPATASDVAHDRIVSDNPANWTPHALDNSVQAIAQVGDTVVAGGDFTRIGTSDSGTKLNQASVFAFDATTGELREGFRPLIENGTVDAVAAHPDGDKGWIGGSFSNVNGVRWPKLALLDLSDGSLVTSFARAPANGKVLDLAVVGDRLILGGTWTSIKGQPRGHLAALDIDTGSLDESVSLTFAGTNNGGTTRVSKFDVSPTGSRLVAIGNFTRVDGLTRSQIVTLDLTGNSASVADWHTARFPNHCSGSFDSYMRDVDIDPEGQYFVVVTTGAYRSGRLCDTASRWELGVSGSNLQPTWVSYTGGDTLYSVAATGPAVYVGGHQRWHNNPFAGDKPGPGAVEREGIAALDPINGVPLSWNPGRNRGVGAFALTATPDGLWVGSDTDRIGRWEYHGRVAFFPLQGGTVPPTIVTGDLPGRLLSLGDGSTDWVATNYDGSTFSHSASLSGTATATRAATMIGGKLLMARANGDFEVADWDGTSLGTPAVVPDLGLSAWRTDIAYMTGLYYHAGRLYFTRSDSTSLFYRYYTVESGIIGAERFTVSGSVAGLSYANVRGMTKAGSDLYWVDGTTGDLRRTSLSNGVPTAGTTVAVSGPALDGRDWRQGPLVLQALADGTPTNLLPVAAASATCEGLDCHFSSVGTGDPDGQVVSRTWDLGDGTFVDGATVDHRYTGEGPFTVTLTVTDDDGASSSRTITVSPDAAPVALIEATCSGRECTFDGSASTDGGDVLTDYTWDLGDGSTATGPQVLHTFEAAGTYDVSLTVQDDEGNQASTPATVTVADLVDEISFVDVTAATANAMKIGVTAPSSTAAGDAMLLVVTGNRADVDYTGPGSGWAEVARVVDSDMTTIAWQRAAAFADAGASVEVAASDRTKLDAQLVVYRGVDLSAPVASATAVAESFVAEHTTPSAQAAAGAVVVSYWADKSSDTTSWSAPSEVTVRGMSKGVGGGRITSLLADQPPHAEAGPAGGLTATADAASGKATMLTFVLPPRQV